MLPQSRPLNPQGGTFFDCRIPPPQGTRVRTPPPGRSPCSRPRPRCACPAGKLHSASAPQRTPCLLCRRNRRFPAVQWMRWGAYAPWKQGETGFNARRPGYIRRHRVQQGKELHTSRSGARRRSHIAAARRRKRVDSLFLKGKKTAM